MVALFLNKNPLLLYFYYLFLNLIFIGVFTMRLPDPFIDPSWPGVTSCMLSDNSTYQQDELGNNTVIQVTTGSQYYSINLEYSDLLIDEYDKVMNFIAKAKSNNDYLEVLLPQLQNLGFKLNTTLAQNGLKGNTLIIPGVTSVKGRLKLNQFIQLSNHPKLYQVIDYAYDSSAHTVTIKVYPDLFTTTNNSSVNFTTPMFRGRFKNINGIEGSPLTTEGYYNSISFELRECNT